MEIAAQMRFTESDRQNLFPALRPDFAPSGQLGITSGNLANQEIHGFIMPSHLTATHDQEVFSRKATQLLRHLAEKHGQLMNDSEKRGIMALSIFCPA
jgi:prolipoprotein diacylglyceryltransferase